MICLIQLHVHVHRCIYTLLHNIRAYVQCKGQSQKERYYFIHLRKITTESKQTIQLHHMNKQESDEG